MSRSLTDVGWSAGPVLQ